MFTQEQLAAIVRATGQLPPAMPASVPSPQLPRLPARPAVSWPMPSSWSSLIDSHGKPVKEPPRKRGRPKSDRPTVRDFQKIFSRPAGVSQAKGVNKEVELLFKERLSWMVEQLHLHYMPSYKDGKMLLERRDAGVRFDGVCAVRAPELPRWLWDAAAQQVGADGRGHEMEHAVRDAFLMQLDVTGLFNSTGCHRHLQSWMCEPGNRCTDCRDKGRE